MEDHEVMIDKSAAIALARAAAEKEGWSFVEPVAATLRRANLVPPRAHDRPRRRVAGNASGLLK